MMLHVPPLGNTPLGYGHWGEMHVMLRDWEMLLL
jgi:hypothetical protein